MPATGTASPQITLPIPTRRPPCHWTGNYVSVPADVVLELIDVLRCYLAIWEPPPDLESRNQAASALGASAAGALADLLDAYAAHFRQGGTRELVEQIDEFLQWTDVRAYLNALRDQSERVEIVEALATLYDRRVSQRTPPAAL
jgi:hypothetical protein